MILNLQHWPLQIKISIKYYVESIMGNLHNTYYKLHSTNQGFAPILILGIIAAVLVIGLGLFTNILNPKVSENSEPKYSSNPNQVAFLPTSTPSPIESLEPSEVCSDCDEEEGEGDAVLFADLEGED